VLVTTKDEVLVPVVVGVKVTVAVQLAVEVSVPGQFVVLEKSLPAMVTLRMVMSVLPVFVTTTDCEALGWPTTVAGNTKDDGAT
jgi:hypothetical protein